VNRFQLLKTLAPGFLPLVVFIIADSVWGTRVGLLVAVASGVGELIFSFAREKRIDFFILADTGLVVALGGVSILLENDIFFKLKPALIELLFCLLLGVSVFSPLNLMRLLSRRYLKGVEITAPQLQQFNRSLKLLFFLFLGHTLLIVYAAFFMSRQAWAFVSGGLFYILFLGYFVLELLRLRRQRSGKVKPPADDGDEWFDLVDSEGKVTGRAPRRLCHSGPGMLHAVVHMQVLNRADQIFLQKRPLSKQIQPGKWDTAVGGHFLSGETVAAALKREAAEELGLTEFNAVPMARYVWQSDVESELVFMFLARYEKPIAVNAKEISEGKFWKIKKIRENLGKAVFTPNFEFEFDILLKQVFKPH